MGGCVCWGGNDYGFATFMPFVYWENQMVHVVKSSNLYIIGVGVEVFTQKNKFTLTIICYWLFENWVYVNNLFNLNLCLLSNF